MHTHRPRVPQRHPGIFVIRGMGRREDLFSKLKPDPLALPLNLSKWLPPFLMVKVGIAGQPT